MSDVPQLSDVREIPDVPDYPLADTVVASTPAQLKALSDPIRRAIIDLVMDRAATVTELAQALGRPRGTVDHHLKVLANAGIVRVVRTRQVRALTERYWGRTARTIRYDLPQDGAPPQANFVGEALEEIMATKDRPRCDDDGYYSTLRHARIATEHLAAFAARLDALALEFTATPRGGDTVSALLIALFPTDRPMLPEPAEPKQ